MKSIAIGLACLWTGAGCFAPHSEIDTQTIEHLRSRATSPFASATFCKPNHAQVEDPNFGLSPLIVSEMGEDALPVRFGALRAAGDSWSVDPAEPTVYTAVRSAHLGEADYTQHVFIWWYPSGDMPHARRHLRWRMLRMTLDTVGAPVLWEMLSSEDRFVQVYAARSLEGAAAEQFGHPADRTFAIDRGGTAGRVAVVVRILDDGPAPMGPMVYVDAGEQRVRTVLCRCMPAQVAAIEENLYYTLMPIEALADAGLWADEQSLFLPPEIARLPDWAEAAADPAWLDKILRLPRGF